MFIDLRVKYPLFLSDFNETSTTVFREVFNYQISWQSVQWEPSCSLRTNGLTDLTKLIVAFRNFWKAP